MNNWSLENIYTESCEDLTIMLYPAEDSIEVYYRKPGYAFMFAFGLSKGLTTSDVMEIAKKAAYAYSDMFD